MQSLQQPSIQTSVTASNKGGVNYNVYEMSRAEKSTWTLIGMSVMMLLGFIFYQNVILSSLLALAGIYYPKIRKEEIILRRKKELSVQFKNALYALSSNLTAGRSIENACLQVIKDLKLLYPDPETFIIKEFELINRKIDHGESVEGALLSFSMRTGINDIEEFANIMMTCKRKGGDMIDVMRKTSQVIGEKLELRQELQVLIAQKKFESKMLTLIPVMMIALLAYSSPDYMSPLYGSVTGFIVMTLSLVLLSIAYWWSQKIMRIEV